MQQYMVVVVATVVVTQGTQNLDTILNSCISSKHHKQKPGPESKLFDQCTPWKDRSCCTDEVAEMIHKSNPYNFYFDHCNRIKEMSDKCRRHFLQDNCFYECSPNVGPWVVKENRSWRKERFYQVPLCSSDCLAWFLDCANDYTCTDNWSLNFEWRNTTEGCHGGAPLCLKNYCPRRSTCQTFGKMYGTPENFCEKVWNGAWKYSKSNQCMRLWFNGSAGNPNDAVARHYARLQASTATAAPHSALLVTPLALAWTIGILFCSSLL